MMSELLKQCRYYRGEKENPFENYAPAYLWMVEKDWVAREIAEAEVETLTDVSSDALEQYRNAGLIDFEKSDGIWLGLKVSLYQLLQHWNEGMASVEDWKRFYADWKDRRL